MFSSSVLEEKPESGTTCDPISSGMVTTCSNMIVPPEACAMRAATCRARSARFDPSRGTTMRLNIILLLCNCGRLWDLKCVLSTLLHCSCPFDQRRMRGYCCTVRSNERQLPAVRQDARRRQKRKKDFFGTRFCILRMRGPEPWQRASPSALPPCFRERDLFAREGIVIFSPINKDT